MGRRSVNALGEEEQGAEGLVLRAGRDVPGDGQVREELLHLGGTHLTRMAFVVEQDKLPIPFDEARNGVRPVAPRFQEHAQFVEQFRCLPISRRRIMIATSVPDRDVHGLSPVK